MSSSRSIQTVDVRARVVIGHSSTGRGLVRVRIR